MTKPRTIIVSAPAKLNLLLTILGRRADKYHEVLTLLQSVDLCDQLEFSIEPAEEFEIEVGDAAGAASAGFPLDASNLIYLAAQKFMERLESRVKIAMSVQVTKNIPIGAGLAGGSADAAATLLALNSYFADHFSLSDLTKIAAELGSDVPFSLIGGTMLGQGKGDQLKQASCEPKMNFIIVKPREIAIASSWAYSVFGENRLLQPDQQIEFGATLFKQNQVSQVMSYLADKSIEQASQMFGNDLESAVFKHHPVLEEIQESLLEDGCLCAHMTGSGSTIYGVLNSKDQGEAIIKSFAKEQNRWASMNLNLDAWLVQSLNHGVRIINNSVRLASTPGNKIK